MLFPPFCWGWNLIQTFGFQEVKLTFLVFVARPWKAPLTPSHALQPASQCSVLVAALSQKSVSPTVGISPSPPLASWAWPSRCACPSLLVFLAQGTSASCLPLFLTEASCCVPVFPFSYSLCFLENRSEFLLWDKIHGPHQPSGDPVWPALPSVPTQTTGAL